jgi:hypothetical protein
VTEPNIDYRVSGGLLAIWHLSSYVKEESYCKPPLEGHETMTVDEVGTLRNLEKDS